MRDCEKNKVKLQYATYDDEVTIYAKDSNGNVIYDNGIARVLNEVAGYNIPVFFESSFSESGDGSFVPYGFNSGDYSAVVTTTDKSLPIDEKSLIWYKNEPTYTDGVVNPNSADYSVKAVLESQNSLKVLLKKLERGQ